MKTTMTSSHKIDLIAAVKILLSQCMRPLFAGLGFFFCLVSMAIILSSFLGGPFLLVVLNFLSGFVLLAIGVLFMRTARRPVTRELHFDPKFQEFILISEGGGLEAADCVLPREAAHMDVNGRHLSLTSEKQRTDIHIALEDAELADRISQTCGLQKKAA